MGKDHLCSQFQLLHPVTRERQEGSYPSPKVIEKTAEEKTGLNDNLGGSTSLLPNVGLLQRPGPERSATLGGGV